MLARNFVRGALSERRMRASWPLLLFLGIACAPSRASESPAATPLPAPPPLPEDRIAEIVAELQAEADAGHEPDATRCVRWTTELEAIHEQHGERYADALLYAGKVWRWCQRPELAIAVLDRATWVSSTWARAQAYAEIAAVEQARGRSDRAEAALQLALEVDPTLDIAALGLAKLKLDRYAKTHDQALFAELHAEITGYLEAYKGDPQWLLVLARLQLEHAGVVAAAADEAALISGRLFASVDDDAVRSAALVISGRVASLHKDDATALRAYQKAAELDPTNGEAWADAALMQIRMRDFAGALESIAHAQQDPRLHDDRTLARARGSALVALRQYERARRLYERLALEEPADFTSHFDLAVLAEQQAGEIDDAPIRENLLAEAAQHYRMFLQQSPTWHVKERERASEFLHRWIAVE
jgi:tetratricopeptide (TPR) repeat protein